MPRKVSPARQLVKLLEAAAAPIYLLDSQRRIVYGNAAFGGWIGRPADELAGVRCDYHTSPSVSGSVELAAALCPPPAAFSGESASGVVAAPRADGKLDQRSARFVPIPLADDSCGLLVVVGPSHEPIATVSKDAELASERLHTLLTRLRSEQGRRYHIGQLIGQTAAIRRVREQVRLASHGHPRVLVVGPPGSGREHVAKTIHYARPPEALGPLVPIDCPLVDAEEMQATLTSLLRRQADSPPEKPPVALLLEVDRLRTDAQQELAGFLELPGIELCTLATGRTSLQRLASKGRFRRSLAYALSTLTIQLPPLAARQDDIPLLAQFCLEEFNAEGKQQLAGFAAAALEELVAYPWPGNVAELVELVREACQRAQGPHVQAADLPEKIRLAAGAVAHPRHEEETIDLDAFLGQIERELIDRALKAARNNKTRAAELLGVNRARLLRRLVQLGLAPPQVELPATQIEPAAERPQLVPPPPEEEPVIFEPLPDEP